jgi:hypothetical protein
MYRMGKRIFTYSKVISPATKKFREKFMNMWNRVARRTLPPELLNA